MKSTLFAAVLATGLAAGAVHAQAPDVGTGHAQMGGLVAGGGVATLSGGGDDAQVTYARGGAGGGGGAFFGQPGRMAAFAGSDGDGRPRLDYTVPAATGNEGREAWLSGGGDDAQVVHTRPR